MPKRKYKLWNPFNIRFRTPSTKATTDEPTVHPMTERTASAVPATDAVPPAPVCHNADASPIALELTEH